MSGRHQCVRIDNQIISSFERNLAGRCLDVGETDQQIIGNGSRSGFRSRQQHGQRGNVTRHRQQAAAGRIQIAGDRDEGQRQIVEVYEDGIDTTVDADGRKVRGRTIERNIPARRNRREPTDDEIPGRGVRKSSGRRDRGNSQDVGVDVEVAGVIDHQIPGLSDSERPGSTVQVVDDGPGQSDVISGLRRHRGRTGDRQHPLIEVRDTTCADTGINY